MSRKSPDLRAAAAPTLIDVAKVAGVSPITVSRALGCPEVVSAATRKRVLEAVRANGYVPKLAAGVLASSRSRLVAIFLPTIANSIFADTVQELTDSLAAAGYQTLLCLTGYDPQQRGVAFRMAGGAVRGAPGDSRRTYAGAESLRPGPCAERAGGWTVQQAAVGQRA